MEIATLYFRSTFDSTQKYAVVSRDTPDFPLWSLRQFNTLLPGFSVMVAYAQAHQNEGKQMMAKPPLLPFFLAET
jgi:hypothetical protein